MLTDYKSYNEAQEKFKWGQIWDVFDGDRDHLNVAHECIDRHPAEDTALRLKFDDGRKEEYTFGEMTALTSKFAHAMEKLGVAPDDRVAVMLEPSKEFYTSIFGAIKRGAILVPCFTLFGPDALEYRMKDSKAKVLVTTKKLLDMVKGYTIEHIIVVEDDFDALLKNESDSYPCKTNRSGSDVAVYQYTSGTTRKFPEAVKHYHKSVPVGVPAAVFGMGLRKGERFFCPSNPAWGHGLWYGTFAPLAQGVGTGTLSGRFSEKTLLEALEEFEITNLSAAPTVFRRIKNAGIIDNYNLKVKKITYTGEPMDIDTFQFIQKAFGVDPHSMYGSTEVGPIVAHFAGFDDWEVLPGSLGKPFMGVNVAIIDEKGNKVPQGTMGEIAVMRKDGWFRVKDAAVEDERGYWWHKGRVDDVILSSGWTISSVEVEDKLQKHKNVLEAVVIGVPDKDRGEIVRAYVTTDAERSDEFKKELQEFVKLELSRHEYPREIIFVDEIPKTVGGKINRKAIKDWVKEP